MRPVLLLIASLLPAIRRAARPAAHPAQILALLCLSVLSPVHLQAQADIALPTASENLSQDRTPAENSDFIRSLPLYHPALFEGLLSGGSFSRRIVIPLRKIPLGYERSLAHMAQHVPLPNRGHPLLPRSEQASDLAEDPSNSFALPDTASQPPFAAQLKLSDPLPNSNMLGASFELAVKHFHAAVSTLQLNRFIDELASAQIDNETIVHDDAPMEGGTITEVINEIIQHDETSPLIRKEKKEFTSFILNASLLGGSIFILLVSSWLIYRYSGARRRAKRRTLGSRVRGLLSRLGFKVRRQHGHRKSHSRRRSRHRSD